MASGRMRRGVRAVAAALAASIGLTATTCLEKQVTEAKGAAGIYTLFIVNGTPVGSGYTLPGPAPAVIVKGGTVNLGGQTAGTYAIRVNGTTAATDGDLFADGGQFATTAAGAITFTSTVVPPPDNVYSGTLAEDRNSLTVTFPGRLFGRTDVVAAGFRRQQ